MTQNTLVRHDAHTQPTGRRPHQPARPQADAMLRDMAFVLAMTRKVRDEIVAERDAKEVLAV